METMDAAEISPYWPCLVGNGCPLIRPSQQCLIPVRTNGRDGDPLIKVPAMACTSTHGRADDAEDLVYGVVGRQRAVEDAELALEPLGDVVTPACRGHASHLIMNTDSH